MCVCVTDWNKNQCLLVFLLFSVLYPCPCLGWHAKHSLKQSAKRLLCFSVNMERSKDFQGDLLPGVFLQNHYSILFKGLVFAYLRISRRESDKKMDVPLVSVGEF